MNVVESTEQESSYYFEERNNTFKLKRTKLGEEGLKRQNTKKVEGIFQWNLPPQERLRARRVYANPIHFKLELWNGHLAQNLMGKIVATSH